MKGYKFKLDAVLKVRKLKEDQCKMQLGKIQVEINKRKEAIEDHKRGIEASYESHEAGLNQGLNGRELMFHPYFVQTKNAHIKQIETEIESLELERIQKLDELTKLRGDVKIMEDMKEKDKLKYKKHIEKKQWEDLEEQILNWQRFAK